MSGFHYAIYSGLGATLVLLSVWRLAAGTKAGPLKFTGLVLGAAILAIMAGSLVGIFSLTGVEECLKDKHSGRSKLVVCLFHTRMAMK
jgi:hypothetical protein